MDRAPDAASELYRAYRREVEGERMRRSARSGAAITLLLNSAFAPLDWFAFREHFAAMLAVRLACNAVLAAVWLFGAQRWPLAAATAGVAAIGGMLLAVIAAAGGVAGPYSPGLMLLFLGIPVLLPFSAGQAARIIAALFLALSSLPLFGGEVPAASAYVFHLVFPAAAGLQGVFACAVLDGLRFTDFERRRALERLDEDKSRFTANVHHELRTPLTLMLAPLEAMLTGDFGAVGEGVRGYLATMHANGLRLLKLINNLLDLAKIESGRLGIARRRLHPGRVVAALVAAARPLAERKGVTLATAGLEALPEVCADADALEKIVVNLVGNALKFTDAGGRIEVSGEARAQGGVRLVVADSGCGIPPTELERVFDRFAQVDGGTTRRHEGTGIGLSLVRELAGLHGGTVRAESEGAGRGTRMVVELPLGEPDAVAEESPLDESAAPAGMAALEAELGLDPERGRMVELEQHVSRRAAAAEAPAGPAGDPDAPEILVCEDNPDMRRLLVQLLAREFRVHAARDGREGLEHVRRRPPAVVLTDVMMPEMSGTELCRALKADPATAGIPVVLVTSKAEREMRIEGLEQGADDYVAKPFHPRELLARVRALARLRRLQEEAAVRSRELERANAELEAALAELRETGLRLAQSERLAAVGELAAGIAHEANNPVNFAGNAVRELVRQVGELRRFAEAAAALGAEAPEAAAELAKLRAETGLDDVAEAVVELAAIAGEGLERTQRLVGDLRDFATPGSGARGPVDLRRGLASTAQLLGYALRQARVELRLDVEPGLPQIEGDARALNQVFLNLLKNAIEALEGRGGTLWVSGRREGEGVLIEVRDDGPGIAPEALERVFEPFHTTKAAGRGTGLGLAISRRIAREHGGSLEAGLAPEGGAALALRLPLAGGRDAA